MCDDPELVVSGRAGGEIRFFFIGLPVVAAALPFTTGITNSGNFTVNPFFQAPAGTRFAVHRLRSFIDPLQGMSWNIPR
jgi:hypothetical protein